MSDVYCRICGEPWDYYGLKHGDVSPDEAEKILRGEGCPNCCHENKLKGNYNREYLSSIVDIEDDATKFL